MAASDRHRDGLGDDADLDGRFTRLFEDTYRDVLAYAVRRTRNRSDAEDVVAGTYLVAWRRLEDVLAADAPIAWLYGIAYRTLANQRRTHRRAAALQERLNEDPARSASDQSPDTAVARGELTDVLQALGSLKERDQEVLRLAAFEGLTPTEISAVLGIRPIQARNYLYRARQRLQRAMDARVSPGRRGVT